MASATVARERGASGAAVMTGASREPSAGRTDAVVLELRAPPFLDVPEVPDAHSDRPDADEHADDQEPEQVDIDVLEPVPERAGQVEVRAIRPPSSIVPITSATATDRPVIVRL